MSQDEVLEYLKKHKKGTVKEIANALNTEPNKIPHYISRLEIHTIKIRRTWHVAGQGRRIVTYHLIEGANK